MQTQPEKARANKNAVFMRVSGVVCSYAVVPEQKARVTYEHLMNMTGNEQIIEPLFFLREREIVHYQRFGECLDILQNLAAPACACRCRPRRCR